ncbi:hypothetical protein AB7M47_004830 [Bradyrhizobium elkanii]
MGGSSWRHAFPESVARPQRAAACNPARRVLLRSVIFTSDRALISALGQKPPIATGPGDFRFTSKSRRSRSSRRPSAMGQKQTRSNLGFGPLRASTGKAALTDTELVFHALRGTKNGPLLLREFFGPRPHVCPLDRFQHNPAHRIVSKRTENDTLPDAHAGAACRVDKYPQIFGIDRSLDHSINTRVH